MSMTIVGTALTTFPISLMMRRVGRRAGFVACALAGAVGALIGMAAIFQRSFGLFLLGCLLVGIYQASASYYRFAAADTASPVFRPKAISWVMTGGIVAALVGTRDGDVHGRSAGARHLRWHMGGHGAARCHRCCAPARGRYSADAEARRAFGPPA